MTFEKNWKKYVGESVQFKPTPATPFWHLGGECFWRLERHDGGSLDEIKVTPKGELVFKQWYKKAEGFKSGTAEVQLMDGKDGLIDIWGNFKYR